MQRPRAVAGEGPDEQLARSGWRFELPRREPQNVRLRVERVELSGSCSRAQLAEGKAGPLRPQPLAINSQSS